MKKFRLISSIIVISLLAVLASGTDKEEIDKTLWKKAMNIHENAIVIDSHVDTPMLMDEKDFDIGVKNDKADVDLVKMKEGGLDAVFFAVYVSNKYDHLHPAVNALKVLEQIHQQLIKNSDKATLALSAEDIEKIHKTGKRAILIGMENGGPIEDTLDLLNIYYRLGVRYITLTHNRNNQICDSATDKEKWYGLSLFGRDVVARMNELGMIIDVSHISDRAFWDVLEISKAPVIASHSCARALCDAERNLTDEMIKALAEKNGVIQINFYGGFLSQEYKDNAEKMWQGLIPKLKEIELKYRDNQNEYYKQRFLLWKNNTPEPPNIEILMKHIDHVVKLVGVDHVGLGSDYDGASSYPVGLEDVSGYPLITYHLLKRGYSEDDIKKILGGNLLRVFKKVEETAVK